jgi:RNA polymerase sigma-70 factor (ECF subfamily)
MAIDHLRRMRMVPCAEVYASDAISDEDLNQQRLRTLTDALAELPVEQRRVLLLRHVMGLTPGEIADRLGKSEGSIHGLHHRGRGSLKVTLEASRTAPNVAA